MDYTKLRKFITEELQQQGTIPKIKAELRTRIIKILRKDGAVDANHENINNPCSAPVCLVEVDVLMASLVREFLQFYDLSLTLSIFDPEIASKRCVPLSRFELCKQLGLSYDGTNSTILGHLLKNCKTLTRSKSETIPQQPSSPSNRPPPLESKDLRELSPTQYPNHKITDSRHQEAFQSRSDNTGETRRSSSPQTSPRIAFQGYIEKEHPGLRKEVPRVDTSPSNNSFNAYRRSPSHSRNVGIQPNDRIGIYSSGIYKMCSHSEKEQAIGKKIQSADTNLNETPSQETTRPDYRGQPLDYPGSSTMSGDDIAGRHCKKFLETYVSDRNRHCQDQEIIVNACNISSPGFDNNGRTLMKTAYRSEVTAEQNVEIGDSCVVSMPDPPGPAGQISFISNNPTNGTSGSTRRETSETVSSSSSVPRNMQYDVSYNRSDVGSYNDHGRKSGISFKTAQHQDYTAQSKFPNYMNYDAYHNRSEVGSTNDRNKKNVTFSKTAQYNDTAAHSKIPRYLNYQILHNRSEVGSADCDKKFGTLSNNAKHNDTEAQSKFPGHMNNDAPHNRTEVRNSNDRHEKSGTLSETVQHQDTSTPPRFQRYNKTQNHGKCSPGTAETDGRHPSFVTITSPGAHINQNTSVIEPTLQNPNSASRKDSKWWKFTNVMRNSFLGRDRNFLYSRSFSPRISEARIVSEDVPVYGESEDRIIDRIFDQEDEVRVMKQKFSEDKRVFSPVYRADGRQKRSKIYNRFENTRLDVEESS